MIVEGGRMIRGYQPVAQKSPAADAKNQQAGRSSATILLHLQVSFRLMECRHF
jgi:hypothetical protein